MSHETRSADEPQSKAYPTAVPLDEYDGDIPDWETEPIPADELTGDDE